MADDAKEAAKEIEEIKKKQAKRRVAETGLEFIAPEALPLVHMGEGMQSEHEAKQIEE